MTELGFCSGNMHVSLACADLLAGRTIARNDGINSVKEWWLAAVVWQLNNCSSWQIPTDYVGRENRTNYKLRTGADQAKLRRPKIAVLLANASNRVRQ